MSIGDAAPAPIGQLIHGYQNGHRLLSASEQVHDEVLRIIDRLSDSANAKPTPESDTYLTGYPLPDGRYALARTWYAYELPRPNCVWTHTLLLTPEVLANDGALYQLERFFQRPKPGQEVLHLKPLSSPEPAPSKDGTTSRLWGVPDPSFRSAVLSTLTNLYEPGGTAVISIADSETRDALALALWTQQWPRLRQRFSFCTGAVEPRRLGARHPFDLTLVPASRSTWSSTGREQTRDRVSDEMLFLLDELLLPNRAFRQFLAFCGSSSSNRLTMGALARVWMAVDGHEPPDDRLARITQEIVAIANEPHVMRRLKRALFRIPGALVEPTLPATTILRSLVSGDIANAVAAEDASLERWAQRAWSDDPSTVLDAHARAAPSISNVETSPLEPIAVCARRILHDAVSENARPADVPLLASRLPSLVTAIGDQRDSDVWWAACVGLPRDQLFAVIHSADSLTLRAVRGLCGAFVHSTDTAVVVDEWEELADENPGVWVPPLIESLTAAPDSLPSWRRVANVYPVELAQILSRTPALPVLRTLAELCDPLDEIRRAGFKPWMPLVDTNEVETLNTGLALLLVVLLVGKEHDPAALGTVYGYLYRRLTTNQLDDGWKMLRRQLPGDDSDWDRCRRLADGVADRLNGYPSDARDAVFRSAWASDMSAATALEKSLFQRQKKRGMFSWFDDWF